VSKNDFRIAVQIDAPPDRVWAIMRDVECWHEWTPSVTGIRLLDGGPLRIGSRLLVRQPKLPPAMWRVTELDDAGRGFISITRSPGVSVTAHHWVEPSDGGSRVTLSIQFTGLLASLVARLTRDLNNRYLALEADGLKRRSERISPST
jgi:hypothetical protein